MKQRILVVEDEVQIATILKIELEYEGYEAVSYTHLTLPTICSV